MRGDFYIVYQDLLDSGLPLATFAKACKLSKITNWKLEGIPEKYEKVLLRVLKKNGFSAHLKQPSSLTPTPPPADSVTPKKRVLLANNIKTAVALQPRGFAIFKSVIENRPDLSLLQSVLMQKIGGDEERYYKDLDALTYAQSDNTRPLLEYYFLSSVVRKIEKGIHVKKFKLIRADGGTVSPSAKSVSAANCGRRVMPATLQAKIFGFDKCSVGAVDIIRSNGVTGYHGLMVCNDVWGCPLCARKVSERRKNGLRLLLDAHVKKYGGGTIVNLLFTIPHGLGNDLSDISERMHKAWRFLTKDTRYQVLVKGFGVRGSVRSFESTYGKHGYHPHFHVLLFFDKDMAVVSASHYGGLVRDLKTRMFALWSKSLIYNDFSPPDLCAFGCACIATDSASLSQVADYFGKVEKDAVEKLTDSEIQIFLNSKKNKAYRSVDDTFSSRWDTEHEFTKWHIKKAGDYHYSMLDFLRGYAICDLVGDIDNRDIFKNLWLTYRFCFRGARQLFVKHHDFKIKELVLSDDEVAALDAKDVTRQLLAAVSFEDWVNVLKVNGRSALWLVADKTDGAGVADFFAIISNLLKNLGDD